MKAKVKKSKVKKIKAKSSCGCNVDIDCGVCVLSPKKCTNGILAAYCPKFSNLIYENTRVELAKIIGESCAQKYCKAVCKAKKKASEVGEKDWTKMLSGPWNTLYNELFKRWYAWALFEKAARAGKLELKEDEDLEEIREMAKENKLHYGRALYNWFRCQSCFPCCTNSTSHNTHTNIKDYLNTKKY